MAIIKASPLARSIYGYTSASFESWCNYGYALLIVAGADGQVADQEMEWLLNVHEKILEAPGEVVEALCTFDYKNTSLEEVLDKIKFDVPINYKRTLLYDAIKMAHADHDFSQEEQDAVWRASELLGIEKEVSRAFTEIVNIELYNEKMRRLVLLLTKTDEQGNTIESEIVDSLNLYVDKNFDGLSSSAIQTLAEYGKALLIVAGADGQVAQKEWQWIEDYFMIIDEDSQEALDIMRSFDYKNANLEEILTKIDNKAHILGQVRQSLRRTLLYHAILISKADEEYSTKEQNMVRKAAKLLDIDSDTALLVEGIVNMEEAVDRMRKNFFEVR